MPYMAEEMTPWRVADHAKNSRIEPQRLRSGEERPRNEADHDPRCEPDYQPQADALGRSQVVQIIIVDQEIHGGVGSRAEPCLVLSRSPSAWRARTAVGHRDARHYTPLSLAALARAMHRTGRHLIRGPAGG